jgi:predicted patatin/cPLA2 family phospholipase
VNTKLNWIVERLRKREERNKELMNECMKQCLRDLQWVDRSILQHHQQWEDGERKTSSLLPDEEELPEKISDSISNKKQRNHIKENTTKIKISSKMNEILSNEMKWNENENENDRIPSLFQQLERY